MCFLNKRHVIAASTFRSSGHIRERNFASTAYPLLQAQPLPQAQPESVKKGIESAHPLLQAQPSPSQLATPPTLQLLVEVVAGTLAILLVVVVVVEMRLVKVQAIVGCDVVVNVALAIASGVACIVHWLGRR